MRKLFTVLIGLCVLNMSLDLNAASYQAKVLRIEFGPTYGDIVYVDLTIDNTTECASNGSGFDYSFDSGTKIGEKIFSALLAAQRSNKEVKISGTGACTLGGNTEDIKWVQSL